MIIEQIVDVPPSHRLIVDVPQEVPAGVLTFTPKEAAGQVRKKKRVFGYARGNTGRPRILTRRWSGNFL
ncbi:MAG: hypothetical protein LBL28_02685 [Treponema sp.]|jgi:hypothetical protein|nr:hypothetical protein [Treponema sp.]